MSERHDIIMFNMSSWQEWASGIVNRNYHVLKQLLGRPDVGKILAVDYLPLLLKRGLRTLFESILFGTSGNVVYQDMTSRCVRLDESLFGTHPDKLFIYSTVETTVSESLAFKNISRRLPKIGIKNPIVWSYHPVFTGMFERLPASLRVFDAVDNWSEHLWYQHQKQRLLKNYRVIGERADVIFTVADDLRALFGATAKVHWIPNGVDFDHWQNTDPLPDDLAGIPAPILGYTGVIQSRIDADLIAKLAADHPQKSFVFIGAVYPDFPRQKLDRFPNVHFLGQKTYAELPRYVNHFHACLIPHHINAFTQSMNPLKLYEYLACGLPVVTTRTAGVEMFADHIFVASNADSFSQSIDVALREDNEHKRLQRKAAVKPHSWERRVEEMMHYVTERLSSQRTDPDGVPPG